MHIEEYLMEKKPLIDKMIEKYIPRKFKEDSLLFRFCQAKYRHNLEILNKAVADPIWDMLDRGGKRWRPALFLLICDALGKIEDDCLDLAIIPEVIHNGTLIIDDIEDSSDVRRGKPCTNKIFGLDIAINTGNAMYYLPLLSLIEERRKVSDKTLREIYEVYVQEMISLSVGQAMDIAWHRDTTHIDSIREEDYLQMCAYKTGTLARMAARLAAILADAGKELVEKLGRFAESIGVAFQIQDDILDLTGKEFAEKKGGRGQDITEGKLSLIVIHAVKRASNKDRKRLIEILKMHTSAQQLKDEAIAIMQKYDAIEHARKFASQIVERSWAEVETFLPSSEAKEGLKDFAELLIKRDT